MKYERLTDKRLAIPKGAFRQAKSKEEYLELARVASKVDNAEIYNRLAKLEDKIEQGTLIELPCKVGDMVYLVHRDKHIIECWTLTQFSVEEAGIWLHIRNEKLLSAVIHSKSRGVCFTREEAEKRLKELQNG